MGRWHEMVCEIYFGEVSNDIWLGGLILLRKHMKMILQ